MALGCARAGHWSLFLVIVQLLMGVRLMDDHLTKRFAGHMGVTAVLVNVLADKGVIGTQELSDRLSEAHTAATAGTGGPASGHALAEMIRYLGRAKAGPGQADGSSLASLGDPGDGWRRDAEIQ